MWTCVFSDWTFPVGTTQKTFRPRGVQHEVCFVLKASGRSPAEGVGTLGARVTGGCGLPNMSAGNRTWIL